MTFTYTDRSSSSRFVERIWATHDRSDGTHIAPADGCWDLIFITGPNRRLVILSGPTRQPTAFRYIAGSRNIGIRFHPSTYMTDPATPDVVGFIETCQMDDAGRFELFGRPWSAPEYDGVEALVEGLDAQGLIAQDPLVRAILDAEDYGATKRTAQRRFDRITGLPPRFHARVRQANEAIEMLRKRKPIAEVAYATGYADQAHMTRVLKYLAGLTPSEIARTSGPGAE